MHKLWWILHFLFYSKFAGLTGFWKSNGLEPLSLFQVYNWIWLPNVTIKLSCSGGPQGSPTPPPLNLGSLLILSILSFLLFLWDPGRSTSYPCTSHSYTLAATCAGAPEAKKWKRKHCHQENIETDLGQLDFVERRLRIHLQNVAFSARNRTNNLVWPPPFWLSLNPYYVSPLNSCPWNNFAVNKLTPPEIRFPLLYLFSCSTKIFFLQSFSPRKIMTPNNTYMN